MPIHYRMSDDAEKPKKLLLPCRRRDLEAESRLKGDWDREARLLPSSRAGKRINEFRNTLVPARNARPDRPALCANAEDKPR